MSTNRPRGELNSITVRISISWNVLPLCHSEILVSESKTLFESLPPSAASSINNLTEKDDLADDDDKNYVTLEGETGFSRVYKSLF